MSKAWMPLYIGDFLADTMHLGPTERGIYISLIMHAWQHGGSIPLDDERLCNITGCEPRLWWKYKQTALQFFDAVDASTAQHKRVSSELLRSDEISNKRKAAALQKHSKSSAKAVQMHTQSQSQSHKKKDKPKKVYLYMPADFQPDREFPKARGWADERIDTEAQRFRDHASMNGRTCKDWQAAWRNWVTSPFQQGGNGNGQRGPRPLQDDSKSASRAAARLEELAKRGEFKFAPRPSLLPEPSPPPVRLLPKG